MEGAGAMNEELMSLEEVAEIETLLNRDNFRMQYLKESVARLHKTARAAHSLQEQLRTSTQALIEIVGAEGPASFEDVVKGIVALKEENEKLRAVFEAARRVLRFNGVDKVKFIGGLEDLDRACEVMKANDAENGEGVE
jgi:hypothetical protein